MKIDVRVIGRVLVVDILGELDLNTAPSFRDVVEEQLDANPDINDILLVMRYVTFIDSSGLGVILGRYKRLRPHGGNVIVAAPSPQARKALELSGLAGIIPICDTEDEAWAKAVGV
ncbi:MAG TPA: anti-sigma factor antagonist [Firmicutes bacterium]|jgi:stage II sporulation protein AA (anti-sigma F factor antagonist)|nr:anti-sigma factor antagonist [Bacillota bacterium]